MRVREAARPASLCSICIEKIVSTPNGDISPGWGTGCIIKDASNQIWIVTNWHVLTGRRPDDPGILLNGYPRSPYKIRIAFPLGQQGAFSRPVEFELYDRSNNPLWIEYQRAKGVDLAAFTIDWNYQQTLLSLFDFCSGDNRALEPGVSVSIVGFPFRHSEDTPFPIWKSGMIATEPKFMTFGIPQFLIDGLSKPGMSGSPIYRTGSGFAVSRSEHDTFSSALSNPSRVLDALRLLSPERIADETVTMDFIGIYAGTTESKELHDLALGRAFPASIVKMMIDQRNSGRNPFPPDRIF